MKSETSREAHALSDSEAAALEIWEERAREDLKLISAALTQISRAVTARGSVRRVAWGQALFNMALSDEALQAAIGRRWLSDNCQMAAASWRPRKDHRVER